MKKIIMLMFGLWPLVNYAQINEAVSFIQLADWNTVLRKAKAENKIIFVDAYTTWCGPCRQMDQEVYTNDELAKILNTQFIPIKIQMDSTFKDNEYVKGWQKEWPVFQKFIDAYPSLLFFSPDGELIGKDDGYHSSDQLISLAKKVIDPERSYLGQIKAFRTGTLDEKSLLNLSFTANNYKHDNLAKEIAKSYKQKYIDTKNPAETINTRIIDFLVLFNALFPLEDNFNKFIYVNQDTADKLFKSPGFSKRYIDFLITRDMFSTIKDAKGKIINEHPNWNEIENKIANSYDKTTAHRIILAEKISFYSQKKDYNTQVKYEFDQIEFRGIDTTDELSLRAVNDMIYTAIFQRPVSQAVLEKAISYMQLILKHRPDNYHYIDTYANILYKAGYKKKAIEEQQKAVNLVKKDKNEDANSIHSYEATVRQMKEGKPTWTTSN
jgi:thioredoxin-related protein